MNNIVINGLKFIFIDIIGDFIYWPVWWYTTGLKDVLVFCGEQIRKTWRALALGIWLKNMFTPMYADRSLGGRAISFVMRIIILIWKLAWFLIWTVIVLALLVIWLGVLPGVVWMIWEQMS